MAKVKIRKIKPHAILYRDDRIGIAWIEDGSSGCSLSVHSNIDSSGSVKGMKDLGYWRKEDRTVRSHGFIYNIDSFVCDKNCELEVIVANECKCEGCIKRRNKQNNFFIKRGKRI